MESASIESLDKAVSERLSSIVKMIQLPVTDTALIESILLGLTRECGKIEFARDRNPFDHYTIISEYPVVSDHYVEESDIVICNNKKYAIELAYKKLKFTDLNSNKTVSVVYNIKFYMLRPAGD
jgi:hypothetical protein